MSNDYVTVNKYKGLEVTEVAKKEVSDDSVEQEVQSRLEAAATEQDVTDRAAQSGDWVNIDYTGTLDGVAFDGGTATGYDLELGSGSFIGASGDYQGFEDQIVGHNTGGRFQQEIEFMRTRWIDLLKQGDPYYNKNLTLSKWNYSLRA